MHKLSSSFLIKSFEQGKIEELFSNKQKRICKNEPETASFCKAIAEKPTEKKTLYY